MSLALDVGTGAVRGGTSILYAGLGETIAERTMLDYLLQPLFDSLRRAFREA